MNGDSERIYYIGTNFGEICKTMLNNSERFEKRFALFWRLGVLREFCAGKVRKGQEIAFWLQKVTVGLNRPLSKTLCYRPTGLGIGQLKL